MELAALAILPTCLLFTICFPCICFAFIYLYGIKALIIKIINKVGYLLNFPQVQIQENHSAGFNKECPICHTEPIELPIQTNCNHKYCSDCIIGWWRSKGTNNPASCPCCRSEISFLLTCYSQNGLNRENRIILCQIQDYNSKFSQTNYLANWTRFYSQDSIAIVSYIWNSFSLLPRDIKISVLMYTLVLIAYVISPIDILPEAILGPIGLIDDGAAIVIYLRQILIRFIGHLASPQRFLN